MGRVMRMLASAGCLFLLIASVFVSTATQPVFADDGGGGGDACGTVSGVVGDASSGDPVGGATVTITIGGFSLSTRSNGDGSFSFGQCLPTGDAVLETSAHGFSTRTDATTVPENGDAAVSIALVPFTSCTEGEWGPITIVLTWGTTTSDLDSHLYAPGGYHVAFFSKNPADFVSLDVDDRSYLGPETVTISIDPQSSTFVAGNYEYWVHNYSADRYGEPGFGNSGAVVTISQCGHQIDQYSVADAEGDSDQYVWRVAQLTINGNGQITGTTPREFFDDGGATTVFP